MLSSVDSLIPCTCKLGGRLGIWAEVPGEPPSNISDKVNVSPNGTIGRSTCAVAATAWPNATRGEKVISTSPRLKNAITLQKDSHVVRCAQQFSSRARIDCPRGLSALREAGGQAVRAPAGASPTSPPRSGRPLVDTPVRCRVGHSRLGGHKKRCRCCVTIPKKVLPFEHREASPDAPKWLNNSLKTSYSQTAAAMLLSS